MPENHPPLETAEDVFRQGGEERLHAAKLKSTDGLNQSRVAFIWKLKSAKLILLQW
jgi:hypothetical protein